MEPSYYIAELMRKPNAFEARKYLGIQDANGNNLLTDFDDSTVNAGRFVQSQPGWDDLRIPLSSSSPGITNPATLVEFQPASDIGVWSFSAGPNTQSVNFELQIPHGVNFSYPFDIHIHWTSDAMATNVRWGITYSTAALNAVFSAFQTVVAPAVNLPAIYTHMMTDILSLPVLDESQVVIGRLFRQAGGGTTQRVFGLSLDAHYVRQSMGSINEDGD